jgi:hypothetical protein
VLPSTNSGIGSDTEVKRPKLEAIYLTGTPQRTQVSVRV